MAYTRSPVKAPRLAGFKLKLFVGLLESPFGGPLKKMMLSNIGMPQFRAQEITESPSPWSVRPHPEAAPEGLEPELEALISAKTPGGGSFPEESIWSFVSAYRSGDASPTEVAKRVVEATRQSNATTPPLRAIIAQQESDVLAQAQDSAERYARGTPRSLLDGVPIAVKDEVDQVPYPTTAGTSFLGTVPAEVDSGVVERLRNAGALLIGKANMTEIGIVVTGNNPHHGAVRNPYDPERMTGGSSSGPGGAVAAGLCPVAVGADGGGSIRMPSAFCGLVGLKPTFGRVTEFGAAPLCWSVAHLGPMGMTARDTALLYHVLSGPDPRDGHSREQPAPTLAGIGDPDLSGLRVGVYRPYFEDADEEVVQLCDGMLASLTEAGASEVGIEIQDIENMRIAQLVTIASEMVASHRKYFMEDPDRYGHDVRLNFSLVASLDGADYVNAQRVRTRACEQFRKLFGEVDLIALPTSGTVAPRFPADAVETGESNLALLDSIMRFAGIANLTGLPAVTFPAGYTAAGLPVGFQLLAAPWMEHLLLKAALVSEHFVPKRAPKVRYNLLGGASS